MSDPAIADLASRQYGQFTRAQALALGATPSLIDRRVRASTWVLVAPGVYSMPGVRPSWRRSVMGACLEAGPGAVASRQTAAALQSLRSFPAGPVSVLLQHGDHQKLTLGNLHQSRDIQPHHCTVVDSIPVTTVPRTFADLAAVVRSGRLRYTVEDALAAKTCTLEELAACYEELRRPGKRGMPSLGLVLKTLGPGPARSTSELEKLLLKVLRKGGVSEPMREYDAPWDRNAEGRVDVAWPWAKVLAEGDSRRWHTRERDFVIDRRRDRLAQLAGWDVYRFTWEEMKDDPDEVVFTMDEALRIRSK